ncbi:hypothetical protein AURDEDRAFT_115019 [Auricularia subglabra TFB-10046 SS5]|nr:hypothetical protein AURDEDRAFT_115019 [Auricularia subglabra TFB-10046 SS5]
MWRLAVVALSGLQLWSSDGAPVRGLRGGNTTSTRLIVDRLGFLDITELNLANSTFLDFNGRALVSGGSHMQTPLDLYLSISPNGTFDAGLIPDHGHFTDNGTIPSPAPAGLKIVASGRLKSLPSVSASDATFLNEMIARKFVPYQNIPDAPGKTMKEIKTLGKKLFPFTRHSFQMAISLYDWTTASFSRLVFMKIFEYTGIRASHGFFPLDLPSVSQMIWESNWGTYTPGDRDFMNSFMMQPAASLVDVPTQLAAVQRRLHEFSAVQNRILAATMDSMPRTSVLRIPNLFSGQVDIFQLGLDHFGIEFLECPLNKGPVTQSLEIALASSLASFVAPGRTITTKMVWSFTDSVDDAMHYQNGILLVANPPADAWVWDTAAYTTPLSDDPAKIEYTFKPGSRFLVQSVGQATVGDKPVVVIMLHPLPDDTRQSTHTSLSGHTFSPAISLEEAIARAEAYRPVLESQVRILNTSASSTPHGGERGPQESPSVSPFRLAHKDNGRRCRCFDVIDQLSPSVRT